MNLTICDLENKLRKVPARFDLFACHVRSPHKKLFIFVKNQKMSKHYVKFFLTIKFYQPDLFCFCSKDKTDAKPTQRTIEFKLA